MKNAIVLLFILSSYFGYTQTIMKTHYENNHKLVHEEYEYSIVNDVIEKNGSYSEYDESGNILRKGNYHNDRKNGEWNFYSFGRIDSIGVYRNDIQHGKWTYYYGNGSVAKEGSFIQGLKSGIWTHYDVQGVKSFIYNYLPDKTSLEVYNEKSVKTISGESVDNKRLNGVFYYYYAEGQLRCKLSYKNSNIIDSVNSYYINGAKLCVAFFDSIDLINKSVFYPNGALKTDIVRISDSVFHYKEFYRSGQLKSEYQKLDSVYFSYAAWDSLGTKLDCGNYNKGNGQLILYANGLKETEANYVNYKLHGKYSTYYSNGKVKSNRYFLNGEKSGVWEEYLEDGRLQSVLHTESNIIERYAEAKNSNSVLPTLNKSEDGEIRPSYPGGLTNLMKYLQKNIIYPTIARENGLEGKVVAKFNVSQIGVIENITILKDGVGGGCSEEVIRIIKNMPLWEPAFRDGIPARTFYTLPVTFKLQN